MIYVIEIEVVQVVDGELIVPARRLFWGVALMIRSLVVVAAYEMTPSGSPNT